MEPVTLCGNHQVTQSPCVSCKTRKRNCHSENSTQRSPAVHRLLGEDVCSIRKDTRAQQARCGKESDQRVTGPVSHNCLYHYTMSTPPELCVLSKIMPPKDNVKGNFCAIINWDCSKYPKLANLKLDVVIEPLLGFW